MSHRGQLTRRRRWRERHQEWGERRRIWWRRARCRDAFLEEHPRIERIFPHIVQKRAVRLVGHRRRRETFARLHEKRVPLGGMRRVLGVEEIALTSHRIGMVAHELAWQIDQVAIGDDACAHRRSNSARVNKGSLVPRP